MGRARPGRAGPAQGLQLRSLLATRWRDRRLLIAGDAAHVMPPFMGQGMCSGMRDAWNLAWKLGLVLDGVAPDRLLDTYQRERGPHVGAITDISIYLGKIICIPDAAAAAARDDDFLSGRADPPPPFPHLVDGLLGHSADGSPRSGSGQLAPHVEIDVGGRRGRLDELIGPGFMIIACNFEPAPLLTSAAHAALSRIGCRIVPLGTETGGAIDLEGRLDAFVAGQGWAAVIIRPDFYVYDGVASAAEFPALVDTLLADLGVDCD